MKLNHQWTLSMPTYMEDLDLDNHPLHVNDKQFLKERKKTGIVEVYKGIQQVNFKQQKIWSVPGSQLVSFSRSLSFV